MADNSSPGSLHLDNEPKDVIVAKDDTLLSDVFALEKRQEAAVNKAADVLGQEFGGTATCEQYKIQKDGTLLVIYSIKR